MKNCKKILITTACVAVLGAGTAFAGGKKDFRGDFDHGRMLPPPAESADGTIPSEKDYIGQISAVDEKAGTVKVTDLDGKETTIMVNPFTHIRTSDSKDDKTIADLKKGDWIMYSFYNTETEKKLASRILVKK